MKNAIYIAGLCLAFIGGIQSSEARAERNYDFTQGPEIPGIDTTKTREMFQDPRARQIIHRIDFQVDSLNQVLMTSSEKRKLSFYVDSIRMRNKKFIMENGYIIIRTKSEKNQEAYEENDAHSRFVYADSVKKHRKTKVQTLTGMDIGVSSYMYNNSLELPGSLDALDQKLFSSTNIVWHLIRQGVSIYRHNFYIVYGCAIDFQNYKFRNNYSLIPRASQFSAIAVPNNFDKNKLAASYLTVPLMFHIESDPHHPSTSFDFGVGGFAGALISSHTKQISDENGLVKFKDDYNMNKFRYGVSAQIGFSYLNFYVNYCLSPFFAKGQGDQGLAPVNFGIVLNGFGWN